MLEGRSRYDFTVSPPAQVVRPTLLLIHSNAEMLDWLGRLFEGRNFAIYTASTAFQASSQVESEIRWDAIISQWDLDSTLGADLYLWVIRNRPEMRRRFIFLADSPPDGFDELVEGRSLVISPSEPAELLRVVEATVKQTTRLTSQRDAISGAGLDEWLDEARPKLLLVDDDPVLLEVISNFLSEAGFAITPVASSAAAIAQLRLLEFDVVLADWQLDHIVDSELVRWMHEHRPARVRTLAFLSNSLAGEAEARGLGYPAFSKGQDSRSLVTALRDIARGSRG